ncbi:DUF6994 family protein [Porticoccus sp.]
MAKIDIDFDYREDSSCGDPDVDSAKLYDAHKLLWDKVLPCGKDLELNVISSGRLLIKNNLQANFSSDRMCPHFDGKYRGKFDGWLPQADIDELQYKVRTIGGHIIFPAHNRNGFTVNQARGVNRKICDRFDLTLECIRRFYLHENSPLHDALERYNDFFDLFVDFKGYIQFFLLQDFVDELNQVRFSLPFDNFSRAPLPQTADEYNEYRVHVIGLVNRRNKRIHEALHA